MPLPSYLLDLDELRTDICSSLPIHLSDPSTELIDFFTDLDTDTTKTRHEQNILDLRGSTFAAMQLLDPGAVSTGKPPDRKPSATMSTSTLDELSLIEIGLVTEGRHSKQTLQENNPPTGKPSTISTLPSDDLQVRMGLSTDGRYGVEALLAIQSSSNIPQGSYSCVCTAGCRNIAFCY
jgi:hypothetical protein